MKLRWLIAAALIAGCGAAPEPRFLEAPPLDEETAAVVYAYLGRDTLELRAFDGPGRYQTEQVEAQAEKIQHIAYASRLASLGLELGEVQRPTAACVRSCELQDAHVQETRFMGGEWTEWLEASIDPRALEVLLPASERGRCGACLEFDMTRVEFESSLPPRFMVPEPERESVILGFRDGRIQRLDLEGNLETLCQLEPELAASAVFVEPQRMMVVGLRGRVELLDIERRCEVQTSTVNPSGDLLIHAALHPSTRELYTLDSSGRIDRFSETLGFRPVAALGAPTSTDLGGLVFDAEERLFAANGSTRFAFGGETMRVETVVVPENVMRSEPLVRGVVFDAELDRIAVTIEGHGLFSFDGAQFVPLAARAGEPGGVVPYRGGYVLSYKNGIVIQYVPEQGLCAEILVGARRTARLLRRLGSTLIVGDAYIPRSEEPVGSGATIMKPRDVCLRSGSP